MFGTNVVWTHSFKAGIGKGDGVLGNQPEGEGDWWGNGEERCHGSQFDTTCPHHSKNHVSSKKHTHCHFQYLVGLPTSLW